MSAGSDFVGERLARFVVDARWDDLPESLRHEGKRSLLNFLGCALGVARTDAVDMAMRVLEPLSGADRVTVFGRPERLDPLGAAFVNAIGGNLLDYDDTHLRTVIHPTAPVGPAVLALAEQRGLPGPAALHAFLLGVEVECRLGNAVSPGHYARGWHITATCGVFGAAVAAAKLLTLNTEQTWHALGIAASQSAGLVENLPSGAKNVGVGNAARNGILAVLMAEQGCTAAPAAIEGSLGWARAMGDDPAIPEIIDGLGERWEAQKNTYKPYPCGIVLHSVIDACLALRRDHAIAAGDIAEVIVSGDQLLLDRGDRVVRNERDTRVSIHHSVAVSFLFGAAGLAEFSEATVHDPAVVALREKTRVRLDAASPRGAATVTVHTTGGRVLDVTVLHPRGSLEMALSDEAIEAKVRDLLHSGGFHGSPDQLIAAVWNLDGAGSVDRLCAALRGV